MPIIWIMEHMNENDAKLLALLESAFEAGFSAGYHSEENPASHEEDWENFKKGLDIRP